jgi:FkbM family methyltransferase
MAWKTRTKSRTAYSPPVELPPPDPPVKPEDEKPYVPEYVMPKLKSYIDQVEIRELDVEGTKKLGEEVGFLEDEDRWIWIKQDHGAWDGPAQDWKTQHKVKYFEKVKNFDVVVTAGANQGMYVRFYAKKFGMVYAFEPDPLNFHCMVINNQLDNVVKLQAALGDRNGFCTIQRNGFTNTGTWSVLEKNPLLGEGHQPIPIMTLDSMNFDKLDLIQLDTEGYELNVIKGAVKTIKRLKPVIIMENGHIESIREFMKTLDYQHDGQSAADHIWIPK